MKKISVYDLTGKVVREEALPGELLDKPVNRDVLYYYVKAFLSNRRQGNAATKTRGEVSGGGKKPWRQKGTGRARVGSSRNPVWRHGGVAFGPKPRLYKTRLPRKVKRQALREALRDKIAEERLMLVDIGGLETPRTKLFSAFLAVTGSAGDNVLFIIDKNDESRDCIVKSLRNLACSSYDFGDQINAYEVLKADKVCVQQELFPQVKNYLGVEDRDETI